jgi:hypothetical protein
VGEIVLGGERDRLINRLDRLRERTGTHRPVWDLAYAE